jgi:hypothetical protein
MAAILEIDDGPPNAWWLSPDIWTVPNDPLGNPGPPVVGKPCYVYARVHNRSPDQQAIDAAVRFWWGNPSVGVIRDPSKLIGLSSATIDPGQAAEVLCLTAWYPIFVNDGHECVVAEVASSVAALPAGPDFDVPNNPQAAQRNLGVVLALAGAAFHFAFEVHNAARLTRRFVVRARPGQLEEIRGLVGLTTGGHPIGGEGGELRHVGFVESACPTPEEVKHARREIAGVEVGPNERRGFALVGALTDRPVLVHIEQYADDRLVGGLSVLALPTRKERAS